MYYFQMKRSLGGKEEGLDKVAVDRRARFLFILSSAPKQQKKLQYVDQYGRAYGC